MTGPIPATSGPTRTGTLFLSYSRRDQSSARDLVAGLTELGWDVWVDWEDIAPTAEWMEEIRRAIEESDAFVAVVSTGWVASATCRLELEHAVAGGKRLVAVGTQSVAPPVLPEPLQPSDVIPLDRTSGAGGLAAVAERLRADLPAVREHTRLLVRATRWARDERQDGALLRGKDLEAAAAWLERASGGGTDPHPVLVQMEYVVAGRRASAWAQRRRLSLLVAGLALSVVLAVVTIAQRGAAIDARGVAEAQERSARSRALAARALAMRDIDPEVGLLLSVEAARIAPTAEADRALRVLLDASRVRVAVRASSVAVIDVAFFPDGSRVVSGSRDGTASIWDAANGDLVRTMTTAGVSGVAALSPDGTRLVTDGAGDTALIWDAATGRRLLTLRGHTEPVLAAAVSPDGSRLATSSQDGTARIWDADGDEAPLVLRGHDAGLIDVDFAPEGTRVVTTAQDGTARVWDAANGRHLATVRAGTTDVPSASFDPSGERLIVAGGFSAIIADATTGEVLDTLDGHRGSVRGVAFSPDGRLALTTAYDGVGRLWRLDSGTLVTAFRGHADAATGAAFSPDGLRVITGSLDGTARIWDAGLGRPISSFDGHTDVVFSAAYSPSGDRVVTASWDGSAAIWDAGSGERLTTVRPGNGRVLDADFAPDGRTIVSSGEDGAATVWDAGTGELITTLAGHGDVVADAFFAPDGDRIVTASRDGTARVWDVASGRTSVVIERGGRIAMSPDGGRILIAAGLTPEIWDARTGRRLVDLEGHTGRVVGVAFSPDGRTVATSGSDLSVRIWDPVTGRPLRVLQDHTGLVLGVAFSPDGRYIASTGDDSTVHVWSTDGRLLEIIRIDPLAAGWTVAWHPDGSRMLVATGLAAVEVTCGLCATIAEVLDVAASRVTRALTAEELRRFGVDPA